MRTLENRVQKKIYATLYALLFLTGLLGLSLLLEGCSDKCEVTREYLYYKPVYTPLAELRSAVAQEAPHSINAVGKIYLKGGLLFVNEPGKGIHVIDNHNPTQPVITSFINIPGNYEIGIQDNILYADSYIDLVALDISDIHHVKEVSRLENVFVNPVSMDFYIDAQQGLVTEWKLQEEVKIYESDCKENMQPWGGIYYEDGIALQKGTFFTTSATIAPGTGSGPGVGGSMARFTVHGNYLYALNGENLHSFNISTKASPKSEGSTQLSWDIETIFPYRNNLFIGSRTGMHIMDITNPAAPEKISTYSHIRVCDPVVVNDTVAYVTLRSGTECLGFTNQLEVINIKNLESPQLLKVYPMTNPHGLGIDQSTLFICDGADGLKVYDAKDNYAIDQNQLAHYKNIHAFDVIPFNSIAMMIGEDGIFQYDYTNPKDIKFLSKINIHHEEE